MTNPMDKSKTGLQKDNSTCAYRALMRKLDALETQARGVRELIAILYPNGDEPGRLSDDADTVLFDHFTRPSRPN